MDDSLRIQNLTLEIPLSVLDIPEQEMYTITRVNYSHVCGDYTLYDNEKKVIFFKPSRPEQSNSDTIKTLLSCKFVDECHIISLSDVAYYPDTHYPNTGQFMRDVIKKAIKNYLLYLLFGDLVFQIPDFRGYELPDKP